MQTFIPYTDFDLCARALDYRRLGKQRVECKQILNAIERGKGGWANHPATRMWRGYEPALRQYMRAIILEWIARGYKNNMDIPEPENYELPPWWGREEIHASHRSALLEKDFEFYYDKWGWEDEPKIEYVWPV
jgi:hypothetical protein